MDKSPKAFELLAPAGDLDKLRTAIRFGADAVYLASDSFGLRARAGNFSLEQLREARRITHEAGVKIYLTLNASLRAAEFPALRDLLEELKPLNLDAYIVADAGVLATVKHIDPQRKLHLSTQANTCNPAAANFWQQAGVCRINLARELTLSDIEVFSREVDIELEAFVHGAMCVAHSGRCLISAAMTGRSANRGDCAQPCRWNYQLTEELRPGQPMSVEEDERGTYFFNSRDLSLVGHLAALAAAGVTSFKIEGRMKGSYYVAITTDVYRQAIDRLQQGVDEIDPRWREELASVSHRPYGNGFLFGGADANITPGDTHYIRTYDFVGVLEGTAQNLFIGTKNRFFAEETLELIGPGLRRAQVVTQNLQNLKGESLKVAQPNSQVKIAKFPAWATAGDMLRRRKAD